MGEQNIVAGISAMPSLHNATSLLFALTAWRMDKRLGAAMYVVSAVMFLGSVHLGWHYAVDAYLGWAMTGLAWWISGCYARVWSRTSWNRKLDETCTDFSKN
ncbi:hypothetical protein GCM10007276_15110 [Agaricicola taiwanensis]|uniref:Inositolphosphotransferase Aur1/Ipt1 domain-containing protein n=1 Tax=Agaricicola taiwanensis TaxID=591372 RepID=A0A8J2VMK8_9RHOB|nr:hypothetical protein GCM10007276_15110 [Agaricicola taiwanensis]